MASPIAKVIGRVDRLDGKVDGQYYYLRIKNKQGPIRACTAATPLPESKDCKELARKLGILADIASKIPSFTFIAQVKRYGTKLPLWEKTPTKEEFYGSYLIDYMIGGIIIGRRKPSDSFKELLSLIPFETYTKKAHQVGKRLGISSYQSINNTTDVGAYVILESLGKKHGFNVDQFMPDE